MNTIDRESKVGNDKIRTVRIVLIVLVLIGVYDATRYLLKRQSLIGGDVPLSMHYATDLPVGPRYEVLGRFESEGAKYEAYKHHGQVIHLVRAENTQTCYLVRYPGTEHPLPRRFTLQNRGGKYGSSTVVCIQALDPLGHRE